jgi:hypothetical protein
MPRIDRNSLHKVLTVNISGVSNTGRSKENSANSNQQEKS